ncbi:hypothetical protein BJY01DRAFT_235269 [Aspergillus pseudoustus]|uniref:Fungal-specific transcription factor domain-containing protein n=1 Tax=Aspergillus pseudoustus TaxID=1810923 RepID=A0ABR4JWU1_9EURO
MTESASSSTSPSSASEASSPDSVHSSSSQVQHLPHRTVRSNSITKTFLFVDAQADSSVGSLVRKQKHAFLIKQYHRERKKASMDRLKAKKLPSVPPLKSSTPKNDEHTQAADRAEDISIAGSSSEGWSLRTCLGEGFRDPFNCYALPMTDATHMYLNHFRIYGVGAYPLSMTLMGQYMFQNAIALPALLSLYMFFAATHVAMLDSKSGHSSETMAHSLQIRGDALKYLNDLLQDSTNGLAESTVITVASFVTIEVLLVSFFFLACMGNRDAVDAHLGGLKRVVRLLGGFDALSHMALFKLYQCDVKAAALKGSHPIFPMTPRFKNAIVFGCEVFDPSNCSQTPPAFLTLGIRFFRSSWFSSLTQQIRASVEIFRRLIIYFEQAAQKPEQSMVTDNDLLVATEHHLHSLRFEPNQDLNEPLRLCLLIYMNIRVWRLWGLPIMSSLAASVRESLNLSLFQNFAPDLVFWMLFMGGMAAQGDRSDGWYVDRLAETRVLLGVTDWAQARGILVEYFYTDQPGMTAAEDLWRQVQLAGVMYQS